jgi:hemolysin activation/secretion protein
MDRSRLRQSPLARPASAGLGLLMAVAVGALFLPGALAAEPQIELPPTELPDISVQPPPGEETLYIREYRVIGSKILPRPDVESAVYSWLGPGRTAADVEGARSALEKTYHSKGYSTVSVTIPQQRPTRGIIILKVTEAPVGRLRVVGSRYYDIEMIKRRAPSLAEGGVPNFDAVQREIIALNQTSDLRVTPSRKEGAIPGTVDIELKVEDKLPLHGSVELNNRYSPNTTPLRLNIDLRYSNLWQLGHTIGVGFQIAPQRIEDALVYSAFYIAPIPGVEWLSVMAQAIRQNSDVSTLGGSAVAGNGEIYGGRLLVTFPGKENFFHTLSAGLDYKHFDQDLVLGDQFIASPITYYPFSVTYNAMLAGKGRETALTAGVVFSFMGMGSDEYDFANRRYNADPNFFYFRGNLAHQQDLPLGFQLFGQLQGQATGQPLVDSEQFSLGGLTTVRGYLESVVLGDSAVAGTIELRSPSLLSWLPAGNEARAFVFLDAGTAWINDPLPEQISQQSLWSFGVGGNIKLLEHFNSSLVLGIPMVTQDPNSAGSPLFTFRLWGEL